LAIHELPLSKKKEGVLLALTLFHFLAEMRLEPVAAKADDAGTEKIISMLMIVPRVGLALIVVIYHTHDVCCQGIMTRL
jgi:hypothetical protein